MAQDDNGDCHSEPSQFCNILRCEELYGQARPNPGKAKNLKGVELRSFARLEWTDAVQ